MATSPLRSKAFNQNRSLSLPSKPNPAFFEFEETLSNVKASEASCSSLSSINDTLKGLKIVFTKIDDLLQSQIISKECQERWADQLLDGHISLLDACATVKDLVSQTKQNVQDLLSATRRKDLDNVRRHLNSRRMSKKIIQKSLKTLRSASKSYEHKFIASLEKDNETMDLVYMLKDAESVTITMLESLLSYLSGTNKVHSRHSGWSLVSKLMSSTKIESYQNEFEKIDGFLQMSLEDVQFEEIMSHLKGMDSSIQNIEEELDCLFRQLIRTRVFVLNLLNH